MAGPLGAQRHCSRSQPGWSHEIKHPSASVSQREEPPEPPDPEARARRRGARDSRPGCLPVDNPETLSHLAAHSEPGPCPATKRVGREQKPGWRQGLTFNRLDVAMFLQLGLSRDAARIGGARGQASSGGRSSQQGPAGRGRDARGGGEGHTPKLRAVSAELGPGTRASSGFPATW